MTIQTRLLTADDLWNMPDNGAGYELLRGELIPMPPSGQEHSNISVNLVVPLGAFVKAHRLGKITGADGGYLLHQNPDSVRAPDIGFVQTSRLLQGKATKKYFDGAPDLAVEVISPNDVYDTVDEKVREFLDAGTRLVWVINPRRQTVTIFRADNTITALRDNDSLSGEDVLPGFSILIAELFA